MSDEGYRELQLALMDNPMRGEIIPGTGGFRKLRYVTPDTDRTGCQETIVMSKKRNLFDELLQGVDAMRAHREGKITLRTHTIEDLPPLEIDAGLIRDTREQLNVSRAVFARHIRVSTRTLENWEQGRAKPNTQAAALIMLVRQYPDTLQKLHSLA